MKTIKKTLQGILGLFVIMVGIGIWSDITTSPEEKQAKIDARLSSCIEETGSKDYCSKDGYRTEAYKEMLEKKLAKEKADREAAALAFKNSPEGKTKDFMFTATGHCRQYTKQVAKFPNKVDFDWGHDSKYWMNFNDKGDSRIMVVFTGEMMNGLGLMVPFKSVCKYDYNAETGKSSMIEHLI